MKAKLFYRRFMQVLVVMVITDCACGDTLDSLIRRRKKIIRKPQKAEQVQAIENSEKKVDEAAKVKLQTQRANVPVKRKILRKKKPTKAPENDIKYIPLEDIDYFDRNVAASGVFEKKEVLFTEIKEEEEPRTENMNGDVIPLELKSPSEIKVKEEPEPEIEVNKERIVTEWMLFRSGVPIDYTYNETADNPGDIVSAPGCPKSIDGYPWVQYKSSSSLTKCYLVGQTSTVCQGSAVMNYQRESVRGVCACNFQECLLKRGLPLNPTASLTDLNGNYLRRRNGLPGKLRYRFCRPIGVTCEEFVYDQKEKRCDIIYSQGPCKRNEWLQRNSKGGVECGKRLCEEGSGLSEKSEMFQRSHGNVTEENAECCRPWGGFSVASVLTSLTKLNCDAGQHYSETLKKCLAPFKLSSLIVG